MELQTTVARLFEPDGPLAQAVSEFRPRAGQTSMAMAVARKIEQGGVLVVEAGTGVGKTFAYLIPSLLSGQRVLLSTATKALQDQLFGRDIPHLLAVLGVPLRLALLKGRNSYVCMQRLGEARRGGGAMDPVALRQLARVEEWSLVTRSGDISELPDLDEASSVIPLITSTRENCLGSRCPQLLGCHVNLARRDAMAADVVVVNHHLFFADVNVRESGVAELLPSVAVVVFDEAHQLNEIGVQFLGHQLTTGQLANFGRDLALQGARWARGLAHWSLMVLDIDRAVLALRQACAGMDVGARRRWEGATPQGISLGTWGAALHGLRQVLEDARIALGPVAEVSPELQSLHHRASGLVAKIDGFSQPVPLGFVRWLEAGNSVRLVESPLDISAAMRPMVAPRDPLTPDHRSWIFTSATLGNGSNMDLFVGHCGLEGAELLQVESPFDYATQAALYVPDHMPKPNDPGHSSQVAALAAQGAEMIGGRTLVLTTTLRAMRQIGGVLEQYFDAHPGIDVLIQGQSSKRELMDRFCSGGNHGARGCILVASNSFWEGVDIPGDALQLLVIDKLPFSPPKDPLVEARSEYLAAEGKNAFHYFHLPQAAIALRQGAGRLIRRETDRGILVVCDVRLAQMPYGRKMLAALPPMRPLSTPDQFWDALIQLTKPSTKDQCLTSRL